MKMEHLETISVGQANHLRIYERPVIKHHLIDVESSLLAGSVKKTVNEGGMKEQWVEEDVTETFTWEW